MHRYGRWCFRSVLLYLIAGMVLSSSAVCAASPKAALPPGTAFRGWKQTGAAKLYNSRNLFDLIDGEAQSVMAYAFVACAHAEYAPANQTKPVLSVDVYDMTDALNAFGLFGSDRQSGKPIQVGAEGVKIGSSGVNFWKGRYVVRTAIFQVNPTSQAAQMAYARATAARIAGTSSPPAIVSALPPGRQPRSEKYVRSNVAGQSYLGNAVTARYPSVGQGAELFICRFPDAAAAKSALERYRAFERSGTGLAPLTGIGSGGFSVVDRYAKNVVVAHKGTYLVGVLRARDAGPAKALVKQAISRLR